MSSLHRFARLGRRRRRPAALTGLVALSAFVLAACGGGSPSAGVASLGSTTTTTIASSAGSPGATSGGGGAGAKSGAKVSKFASCMRSHGIAKFPQPQITAHSVSLRITPSSGIDPKSPRFRAAQSACRHFLPNGGVAPTITPADQADYLKAVTCMRNHGITGFPDPVFGAHGGVQFNLPAGMNANSTAFRKARVICEKLIPAGLPYSS